MKNLLNFLKKQGWFIFAVLLIIFYKLIDNIPYLKSEMSGFFSLMTPFFIGFSLAYIIYPAVMKLFNLLKKTSMPWVEEKGYTFSVLTTYLCFFLLVGVILSYGVPAIGNSIAVLAQKLPEYYTEIVNALDKLSQSEGIFSYIDFSGLYGTSPVNTIIDALRLNDLSIYINSLWDMTSLIISLLMGFVVGAYFLLDKKDVLILVRRLMGLVFSEEKIDQASSYIGKINEIFYGFFYGISLEAIVVGILAGIFFYVYNLPFALLMALIVTIFNVIPYFGPFIATLLVGVITLFTTGVSQAITIIVFLAILNQIDGMLIGPHILGNSLKMSPLWVIFAILIGGGYFGIIGMFLGIPVIAVLRMLLLSYLEYHDNKKNITDITNIDTIIK